MKFCIVGAGWYGCHAATILRQHGHDVHLIDKHGFFSGSSSKNQNRLHIGYHYPRSQETRRECEIGYGEFQKRYGFCVNDIPRNLYVIHSDSKLSFQSYEALFSNHTRCDVEFINVEPKGLLVNEKHINNQIACDFFKTTLSDIFECRDGFVDLNTYDYVINCTNNTWVPYPIPVPTTYETFCSLLYQIDFPVHTAITVVDGPFFSIFPYDLNRNLYTVTHVVHGVVYRGSCPIAQPTIDIADIRQKIETDVCSVVPNFKSIATYTDYFLSSKTKYDFVNDDRSLRWFRNENYISFSGGKITGIFEMEKVLLETILCSQKKE